MSRPLGVTTVLILSMIERRVCYGLDIAHRTGLLPGTVYTTLRRLERRGHVTALWEAAEVAEAERRPRRRYYTLTADGRTALERGRAHLERIGVGLPTAVTIVGDPDS